MCMTLAKQRLYNDTVPLDGRFFFWYEHAIAATCVRRVCECKCESVRRVRELDLALKRMREWLEHVRMRSKNNNNNKL